MTDPDGSADRASVCCIGCGAAVSAGDGPTHRYLGASPGCWALFGNVLAREYGGGSPPAAHHLTVDAYCVQHPGQPNAQTIQSLVVHLAALLLQLEHKRTANEANAAMRKIIAADLPLVWLAPPPSLGALTIVDVAAAQSLAEHSALVDKWARAALLAWAPHHDAIRRWLAAASIG